MENPNNDKIMLLSVFFTILGNITKEQISLTASVIAIIGGVLAIINYIWIFYLRYKKEK